MIGIVYHNYLFGNWKNVITEQLLRLKISGLYDAADIIVTTVNLTEVTKEEYLDVIKDYGKIQPEFTNHNHYEYLGIKKVKELCNTYDDMKILYFHTKGVSNQYVSSTNNDKSDEKITNVLSWKECLEYFVIDKWKECIDKLDEYDNVGVTCNSGWYWGNFWWSQSKHIKKCYDVDYWGRWDYEAWLNNNVQGSTNFQWFNFTYNPYLTDTNPDWYKTPEILKRSKIILNSATYGTPNFEIDSGYIGMPIGFKIDVTSSVEEFLKEQNYERLNVMATNSLCNDDPLPGIRKFLFIDFSFEINPTKRYTIGSPEGYMVSIDYY